MTAITAAHLLRLELAALLLGAAALLLVPGFTIRALGLPIAGSMFWPRLVGAILICLAAAVVATDQGWLTVSTAKGPVATGIGLGAFAAMNLTFAAVLATILVFGTEVPTRRGKAFLWSSVIFGCVMGLVEIAYIA